MNTPSTADPPGDTSPSRRLARRAVRGGAILMAARLLVQLFVWGVTLLVARLLLPSDYGLMTTGMLFLGIADLLAEAGIGRALVHQAELDKSDLDCVFTVSLVLAAALYALLCLAAGPAGTFFAQDELPTFLRVLGLLVLLVPFRTVPLALLDRDLSLGRQAAAHVFASVVQSAIVLGLALSGAGYWALAAGALVGRLLEVIALLRSVAWRPGLLWPRSEHAGLIRFGLHVGLGSILWLVYSDADFAIVGKLFGPETLGWYALAFQLISLPVEKLTGNVNQVIYPVFCRLQHEPQRLRDWYLRLSVLLGFLAMPTLTGMALVAEDAFALVLGERWLPAVVPFQMLSLVGILRVYSHSLPPLFNALGRPDVNLRYTAVCALLFPLAFYVGGTLGGDVVGVCLAWLVLSPVLVAGLVLSTRRLTGIGLVPLVVAQLPIVAAIGVMVGVVLLVRHGMANTSMPWLRLVACIVAGAVSYALVLLGCARRTVLADLRLLVGELRGGRAGE